MGKRACARPQCDIPISHIFYSTSVNAFCQAEITAISNALLQVDHLEGLKVVFDVNNQSVILTLKSNIYTSKTALSCRNQLASFSHRNNVTVRSEERRVGKECRSRWSTYH